MDEQILEFIREINPYEEIDETTELIDEGILDSLTLVLLIEQIESELGIRIPENELRPENFSSVETIVIFLEKIKEKQGTQW